MTSPRSQRLCVAVLGASGLVGREILSLLESRDFPVGELRLLASSNSAGDALPFQERKIIIEEATPASFVGVDLVLASAGSEVSKRLLPHAVRHGVVCIDNTTAFRQEAHVPLVVPEVNGEQIGRHRGIIANPNCSTIQLVVALNPLHQAFGIRRLTVATYQSVSGAGAQAVKELEANRGLIAGNVIPQIGPLFENGESEEERKMRLETAKILGTGFEMEICCVRVPVVRGHAEAVWIETERALSTGQARRILSKSPGLTLTDQKQTANAEHATLPTPRGCVGQENVEIGRLRSTGEHKLGFWIVADNLWKGAALNSIQIAEGLHANPVGTPEEGKEWPVISPIIG